MNILNIALILAIGLLSGIISGMGIGGGAILIPALYIFLGVNQQEAQNINLIYFIPTAVTALITHIKNKNIEKGILLKIIIAGVPCAVLGSLIAVRTDNDLLRRFFGGFLLIMGLIEFFKKEKKENRRMDDNKFTELKQEFERGSLEQKIDIYIGTTGLSHEQYKELLKVFPIEELGRLEAALG